jgi:hypothetical protein
MRRESCAQLTADSHINVRAHPRRLRRASDAACVGCSRMLCRPAFGLGVQSLNNGLWIACSYA